MPTHPLPLSRLHSIASTSCTDALALSAAYTHAQAEHWNAKIINAILSQIAHASAPVPAAADAADAPPPARQYKYAVNSTIIQHLDTAPSVPAPAATTTASAGTSTGAAAGADGLSSPPATPDASGAAAAEVDAHEAGATPAAGTSSEGRTPAPVTSAAGTSVAPEKGRRGMHSAIGAYWNSETDGTWSYKWEGGEKHGVDVVISIIWVAV